MSRLRAHVVPVAMSLLVVVAAAIALSACEAGTAAETSAARPAINSVGGTKGTITVRNVYAVGPADQGGITTVAAAFFNGGIRADALVGVSSPKADAGVVPPRTILPAGGSSIFGATRGRIQLTGLKAPVLVGQAIEVTFSFQTAGDLTLLVPVDASPSVG